MGTAARVTRNAALEVMNSGHVAFARTKGLPTGAIVRRHGVRNAAAPVVAYLGVQLVYLIEGVVVVESLFAWPGIGHALVHAVLARDIPMVQGTALAMGLTFVALNALVDAVCHGLDPRGGVAR
jgi:peptide/nickel transport system permease protein